MTIVGTPISVDSIGGGALTERIRTDPDALLREAQAVESRLTELEGLLGEVDGIVKGTATYWNGEAADAQRRIYAELSPQTENMFERVRQLATSLEAIAAEYAEAETCADGPVSALPTDAIK